MLATLRWLSVGVILAPFAFADWATIRALISRHGRRLLLLSFLGMGVCGGGVYFALQYTNATNATLIYSAAPLLIILLEAVFKGRRTNLVEMSGVLIAFIGVAIIVSRGNWATIAEMRLNSGDLLIALAALAWAAYSLIYKDTDMTHLRPVTIFALLALGGALVNAPMGIYELATEPAIPHSLTGWMAIAGIIVISSLAAFTGFQYGVRQFGPSLAGIFMYLLTPCGVLLAVIFLGEELAGYHYAGITAVICGIVLASAPWRLFR